MNVHSSSPCLVPALAILLTVPAVPSFASGITLDITPNAKYTDSTSPCANANGAWPGCGVNAFLSPNVATSISDFMNLDSFNGTLPGGSPDIDFASAYDSWLLGQSGSGWTTLESGTITGSLTLDVDIFNALACPGVGGLDNACQGGTNQGIDVEIQNYVPGPGDPAESQFFWVQALLINYQPPSTSTSTVYETMDTAAFNSIAGCQNLPNPGDGSTPNVGAGTYCGPAYPFQYAEQDFSDGPMGPYPDASFRGIALLATETSGPNNVNTLTVYGGVDYGFDVYVTPEPGTWIMVMAGFMAIAWRSRRTPA